MWTDCRVLGGLARACGGAAAAGVGWGGCGRRRGENGLFFPLFILKCIILPRQARDKHRESTQKETRFSIGRLEGEELLQ